jgi:hypothetical protein
LSSWNYINPNDFIENSFHFQKEGGKKVNVKVSKVLPKLHDMWVAENTLYTIICNKIKELRSNGATYDDSEELRLLNRDKEYMEEGNIYVLHQKLSNATAGSSELILTINPLDKLSASGASGSNNEFNSINV